MKNSTENFAETNGVDIESVVLRNNGYIEIFSAFLDLRTRKLSKKTTIASKFIVPFEHTHTEER